MDNDWEHVSVHQIEQEAHVDDPPEEPGLTTVPPPPSDRVQLSRQVYGWHPHWSEKRVGSYRFDLLSAASYFSYEADPASGEAKSIGGWRNSGLALLAERHDVDLELTVTNFGSANNRRLLQNETAAGKLVANLVDLVRERPARGVCIDFENVGKGEREALVRFAERLRESLGDGSISIALPAVDWSRAFDVEKLSAAVDRLLIMAYDYHWATAKTAGPVSPLEPSERWGRWSVADSVDTYLGRGVPPEKLLIGLPFYGYSWPTADGDPPASTTGRGKALSYAAVCSQQTTQPLWDGCSSTPFYSSGSNGQARQIWFENPDSLRRKCQLVKEKGIGGIGIWALGYDVGRPELWQVIKDEFAEPAG